jgi:hypothetical protein
MKVRCLTNNPHVILKNYPFVEAIEGNTLDLFILVRQELLQGYKLITHPLTGSIGPEKSPYKTVIMSAAKGSVDEEGLHIIDNAIIYTVNLISNHNPCSWDTISLQDFAIIDYEFVKKFFSA